MADGVRSNKVAVIYDGDQRRGSLLYTSEGVIDDDASYDLCEQIRKIDNAKSGNIQVKVDPSDFANTVGPLAGPEDYARSVFSLEGLCSDSSSKVSLAESYIPMIFRDPPSASIPDRPTTRGRAKIYFEGVSPVVINYKSDAGFSLSHEDRWQIRKEITDKFTPEQQNQITKIIPDELDLSSAEEPRKTLEDFGLGIAEPLLDPDGMSEKSPAAPQILSSVITPDKSGEKTITSLPPATDEPPVKWKVNPPLILPSWNAPVALRVGSQYKKEKNPKEDRGQIHTCAIPKLPSLPGQRYVLKIQVNFVECDDTYVVVHLPNGEKQLIEPKKIEGGFISIDLPEGTDSTHISLIGGEASLGFDYCSLEGNILSVPVEMNAQQIPVPELDGNKIDQRPVLASAPVATFQLEEPMPEGDGYLGPDVNELPAIPDEPEPIAAVEIADPEQEQELQEELLEAKVQADDNHESLSDEPGQPRIAVSDVTQTTPTRAPEINPGQAAVPAVALDFGPVSQ